MKQILLYFLIFLCPFSIYSQNVKRIELKGIIYAETNEIQNVTVYNKSSKKGTITNKKGEFIIEVAINDRIEISALQFQPVTIIIDNDVILNENLKIQLVEEIHNLDAVLLSKGLSGNMAEDIANVKEVKPIILDMGNMDVSFDYNDDKAFSNEVIQDHLKSVINRSDRKYLPNLGKIFDLITKSKKKKHKAKDKPKGIIIKEKSILDVYSYKDLNEIFGVPLSKAKDFVNFVEINGINPEFFNEKNEIKLIEFLIEQRHKFLKE